MLYLALEKLIQEKDFNKIIMQNIIEEAEVSRGTFYKYFKDKYDLGNAYYDNYVTKNILSKYNGNNWKELTEEISKITPEIFYKYI